MHEMAQIHKYDRTIIKYDFAIKRIHLIEYLLLIYYIDSTFYITTNTSWNINGSTFMGVIIYFIFLIYQSNSPVTTKYIILVLTMCKYLPVLNKSLI